MIEKIKNLNIWWIFIMSFVFLLPFHAVFVTFLKCRIGVDMDILRFWKEFVIIGLLFWVAFNIFKKYKFNFWKLYKDNYLLWTITAFILSSFIYIFFPYFVIKISALLWFKYDVFFIFAFLIWMYLTFIKNNFENILKTVFTSIWVILIIFTPWFLSWNIDKKAELLWYSTKVSTYEANSCITFSQNVTWWYHRFQWSFWDPIRFSVFLVVFYFIFLGFSLDKTTNKNNRKKYLLISAWTILVLIWMFYAYTKTSFLWFIFWSILFIYLVRKIIYKKEISKKFIASLWALAIVPISYIAIFKRDLFLHPEAILWRVENLIRSIEMFFYNPIWYWLWIAWPASQLWTSSDSALNNWVVKFLPENWYVQIFLEQSILGLSLFIWVLSIIWVYLYRIILRKKDFLSIWIFVSFITIIFMWNFTHVFEEAATSYILFMILWAYIAKEYKWLKL